MGSLKLHGKTNGNYRLSETLFEMKIKIILLILLIIFLVRGYAQTEKQRIIILTDIENEPDDAQSMVRFLLYANQFDVEGIVATTSCWQRNKIADWRIHEIVDAYEIGRASCRERV